MKGVTRMKKSKGLYLVSILLGSLVLLECAACNLIGSKKISEPTKALKHTASSQPLITQTLTSVHTITSTPTEIITLTNIPSDTPIAIYQINDEVFLGKSVSIVFSANITNRVRILYAGSKHIDVMCKFTGAVCLFVETKAINGNITIDELYNIPVVAISNAGEIRVGQKDLSRSISKANSLNAKYQMWAFIFKENAETYIFRIMGIDILIEAPIFTEIIERDLFNI